MYLEMKANKNRKVSTRNRLDLESLGSSPAMPQNFMLLVSGYMDLVYYRFLNLTTQT